MEWYDILSLVLSCIGFPTVCVIAYKSLYKRIKDADIKRTATQEGIQALLRAQMISDIVNNSWHIFLKHSHTYAVISKES